MEKKKNRVGLIVFLILFFIFFVLPIITIWMLFPSNRTINRMESYITNNETEFYLDCGSVFSITEDIAISLLNEYIPEIPSDIGIEKPIVNLQFENDEIVFESLLTVYPSEITESPFKREKPVIFYITTTLKVLTQVDGKPLVEVKKIKIGRLPLPVKRIFRIVNNNLMEDLEIPRLSENGIIINSWSELYQTAGSTNIEIKEIKVVKDKMLVVLELDERVDNLSTQIEYATVMLDPLKEIINEDGETVYHQQMLESINIISEIYSNKSDIKEYAYISDVNGYITLTSSATTESDYIIEIGTEIFSGDSILTTSDSECELIFYDNSMIKIFQDSIIRVKNIYHNGLTNQVEIDLVEGTIAFNINKQEQYSSFIINGELFSIDISDVNIIIEKEKNSEAIFVLSGNVAVNNEVLSQNQSIFLKNSNEIDITTLSNKDIDKYSTMVNMKSSTNITEALVTENNILESLEPILVIYDAYSNLEETDKQRLTDKLELFYQENRYQLDLLISETRNNINLE